MKALISDLRLMTGASPESIEIGGVKHFSDADLERKLQNRVGVRIVQRPVDLFATIEESGNDTIFAFLNGKIDFEGTLDTETATIVTFWGAPIEGEATIFGDGRIEFSKSQIGKAPLFTGTTYDLNGAAADVLTDWASAVKMGYDITADGQTLTRSQRHAQLLEQAEAFRRQAIIGSVAMGRTDTRPGTAHSSLRGIIQESFDRLGRPTRPAR